VFIAYALAPDALKALLPMDARMTTPQLVGAFLFGSWIFINRNRIPCSLGLAAAAFVAVVLSIDTPLFAYAYFGCAVYITLVLAYHPRVRVRPYLKLGDYSYGLYLLAFPVQQFIVWKYGSLQPLALFVLAFLATLPLAVLSWHFIEKPSLTLKSRLSSPQRWELRLGGTAAKSWPVDSSS
jgi:peptidoglycan/LPS O-acetylase OafA/YrhL